jgi:hypothetical protein
MAAPCGKHRRHAQIAALRMLQALLDRSAAKSLPDASKSAAGPGLVDASSGMLTVMNELFRQANDLAAIAR